jgi:hypothetical protein
MAWFWFSSKQPLRTDGMNGGMKGTYKDITPLLKKKKKNYTFTNAVLNDHGLK